VRAGAIGLSLLADPLDARIPLALEQGPLPLIELRRALGSPPQTTLRKHLQQLSEFGVLTRVQERGFPGAVEYQLGPSGPGLLEVVSVVTAWLKTSPAGPLAIGDTGAKSSIQAFVDGWSANVLRALAARPLSLTELDRLLTRINYPALQRRLSAMRLAGQVVPSRARPGGSTPYKVTRWLRQGVGPLAAAANWEHRWVPERGEALRRHDMEATFLLAVPLLDLPPDVDGSCRFEVEISEGAEPTFAGVVVVVERGHPVSCRADLRQSVEHSASGTAEAWMNALGGEGEREAAIRRTGAVADLLVTGLQRALACADGTDAAMCRQETRIGAPKKLSHTRNAGNWR
jgi:DNA-binding HxlR family transcriptional regulator